MSDAPASWNRAHFKSAAARDTDCVTVEARRVFAWICAGVVAVALAGVVRAEGLGGPGHGAASNRAGVSGAAAGLDRHPPI